MPVTALMVCFLVLLGLVNSCWDGMLNCSITSVRVSLDWSV
ncbi:13431_t:CDS:1, partial [Dentiscutata erythropus]